MNKNSLYVLVITVLAVVLFFQASVSSVNAADRSWRYEAHGRNIDIDICIKCDSPIPGPSGPQGPPGEQGEQGPPGPDKELQVRTVVSSEYVLVPPMESREVSVECNPGEVVTGGALLLFDGNNEGNPSILEAGLPVNQPTQWFVGYYNHGPNDVSIGASAECAKLVDAP